MHDLVIRNGTVVDGTGAPRFVGDVAVDGQRIAAVGGRLGPAKRELDADGHLVAPGWVDVHTHLDGQASWDPLLGPGASQGTTTAIMGNCGVGFAPCRPEERDMLISVMEDVEDIPGTALHEGITWEWESFPDYMDSLARRRRTIDIGAQVPHCAVRCYVMGERGAERSAATGEDIARMRAIVREGIQAGAVGFTTSRTKLHVTRDGNSMPGTYADEDELLGIGRALADAGKGVYGLVSDFDDWEPEMDWMRRLSLSAGCTVNFVLFFRRESDFARVERQLAYAAAANAAGARLVPHVGARPVNILMGFDASVHPFMLHQSYAPLAGLRREERLAKLRDPAVRAAILAEEPPAEMLNMVEAAGDVLHNILHSFHMHYVLGDPPIYEPTPERSVAAIARREGRSAREVAYDLMLERDGKELIYHPNFGYDTGDLSRQLQMMKDPHSVVSLADTGAHCGVLCDATVPSYLLSWLVRDRDRGERLSLEWAVKSHTRDTARCVGLDDRGVIAPGMKADINVVDFENLQLERPEVIYDLPAGGKRIYQGVRGYRATVVSGLPVFERGEHTGELPGQLIRGPQPAAH